MTRRWAVLLISGGLISIAFAGCGSATEPEAAPASNGANYGPDKIPPADQVAPKPGKAARSPGRPPFRG